MTVVADGGGENDYVNFQFWSIYVFFKCIQNQVNTTFVYKLRKKKVFENPFNNNQHEHTQCNDGMHRQSIKYQLKTAFQSRDTSHEAIRHGDGDDNRCPWFLILLKLKFWVKMTKVKQTLAALCQFVNPRWFSSQLCCMLKSFGAYTPEIWSCDLDVSGVDRMKGLIVSDFIFFPVWIKTSEWRQIWHGIGTCWE